MEPQLQTRLPSAPSASPRDPDEVDLLLQFVHERDVPCPRCGYNLRNLTQPNCPECREDLALAVGVRQLRFGWFLVAIAPGIFSGLAALILLIPIVGVPLSGGQPAPWFIHAIDAFGWVSGIAALVLVKHRFWFLKQVLEVQRTWALSAWAVHVAMFIFLLWCMFG